MPTYLTDDDDGAAMPLTALRPGDLDPWLDGRPESERRWVRAAGFRAKSASACLLPGADGGPAGAVAGLGDDGSLWDWAALPATLPAGVYRLDADGADWDADRAALGWALGTYAYTRYRDSDARFATLVWPAGCDRAAVTRAAQATVLVRDLINTPAEDMGPEELADAVYSVGNRHGATVEVTVLDDLRERYPSVHAVGRASDRAPRMIDMTWGHEAAPKVTLVGKGVCFDSGGLDIKPAAGMKLMKKDMGGAAHALGLAQMVMAAALPVRLRLLIPAVENSISGSALRPLDVITTRAGLTVEIGNTDAEGRVILADALAEAAAEEPALLVDLATLTGAARVALGADLPALFCNDDDLAADLMAFGRVEDDPLWRLPLWRPYRRDIESRVADLVNATDGGLGGAITAALFLEAFVKPAAPWVHVDLMGWNTKGRPGRPEGGEAMGLRALYALIYDRFGRTPVTPPGA